MRMLKIIIKKLKSNTGSMLIITYFVSVILTGLGMAFLLASITEGRASERTRRKTVTLSIAEAGLERAIYDLRQDCENDALSPSWSDGDINGMSIGPDNNDYYSITAYNGNVINDGAYSVQLKNIGGNEKSIWIKSTGTLGDTTQTIVASVRVFNINTWSNAVFGGAGSSSEVVTGDANIFGSVHLLGTTLGSSDFAMELGGGAFQVGNNYNTLSASLDTLIPDPDTTTVNTETVDTLDANVWVKNGLIGLSGSGTLGIANVNGNSYKEKIDGVYSNDGFGGSQGTDNVYSDNGTSKTYPLGDAISFPSLADAYTGYTDYQDYLQNNSLVLSSAGELNTMANITPESTFDYNDAVNGYGHITMDGAGTMTISGKVYIDGGTLSMSDGTGTTITYSGTGIILSEGDVTINTNLITTGADSFPTNILGIMTPGNITFNKANIDVMGLFYAEGKITLNTDMELVGTVASNYIDLASGGPSIYQVTSTLDNIPNGMLGDSTTCFMKILSWQKE